MANITNGPAKAYVTALLKPRTGTLDVHSIGELPAVSVVVVLLSGNVDENGKVTNVKKETLKEIGVVRQSLVNTLPKLPEHGEKFLYGVEYRDQRGAKFGVYLSEPALVTEASTVRMDDMTGNWFTAPYTLFDNVELGGDHSSQVYEELLASA